MPDLPTKYSEPAWGAFGPMLPESQNIEDRRPQGSNEGDEVDRAAAAAWLKAFMGVRGRGLNQLSVQNQSISPIQTIPTNVSAIETYPFGMVPGRGM